MINKMGNLYSYIDYGININKTSNRIYNWKKSKVQPHESQYLNLNDINNTKLNKDLTELKNFPEVYDQGKLGSCTANALCCAFSYDILNGDITKSKTETPFLPSRLYLYYKEREMEHHIPQDDGAVIADGIKCLQTKGVCSENKWPYDIANFAVKPSDECDIDALNHKLLQVKAVRQTAKDIETCINAGFPVVFGFVVYQEIEFLSSNNPILPMPKKGENPLGGHAVVIVGYDSSKKLFKIRNSWGSDWGDSGHFYMHYEYLLNSDLASDFWVLSQVSDIESNIKNNLTKNVI